MRLMFPLPESCDASAGQGQRPPPQVQVPLQVQFPPLVQVLPQPWVDVPRMPSSSHQRDASDGHARGVSTGCSDWLIGVLLTNRSRHHFCCFIVYNKATSAMMSCVSLCPHYPEFSLSHLVEKQIKFDQI